MLGVSSEEQRRRILGSAGEGLGDCEVWTPGLTPRSCAGHALMIVTCSGRGPEMVSLCAAIGKHLAWRNMPDTVTVRLAVLFLSKDWILGPPVTRCSTVLYLGFLQWLAGSRLLQVPEGLVVRSAQSLTSIRSNVIAVNASP